MLSLSVFWYRQCRQRRQWPTCICTNLPRPSHLILRLRCGSFAILLIFLPFNTGLPLWMYYLIFFSLLLFWFLQQYFTSPSVLHADGVLFETVEPINQSMCNPIPSLPLAPFSTLCFEFFFTLSLEFVFVSNAIIVFVGAGNYICGSARLIRHFPREGEGTHQPNRDGETPDCQLTPTTQWDTDLKYYIIHISYTNNVCWDGDPYTNRVSCCSFDTCCATPGFSLPIKSKLIFPPKTESHHVTCYDDSAPITN